MIIKPASANVTPSWRHYDDGKAILQRGKADCIATGRGKHRPLDNAEIDRICKRMTKTERQRNTAPLLRRSGNGAHPGGKWNDGGLSAAARLTKWQAGVFEK